MTVKLGIIVAMEVELKQIREAMTDVREEIISDICFYTGKVGDIRIVTARCGIGKVFAALCAQTMILHYKPRYLLGAGVAGTLSHLPAGALVIAEKLVQHDMDTSALGDPVGLISGLNLVYMPTDPQMVNALQKCAERLNYNYVTGTIASGDSFIHDSEQKTWIANTFHASACEMEGAAIAQVCTVNHVPFCVIRCISDGGDEDSSADYRDNLQLAAAGSANTVLEFIKGEFFHG